MTVISSEKHQLVVEKTNDVLDLKVFDKTLDMSVTQLQRRLPINKEAKLNLINLEQAPSVLVWDALNEFVLNTHEQEILTFDDNGALGLNIQNRYSFQMHQSEPVVCIKQKDFECYATDTGILTTRQSAIANTQSLYNQFSPDVIQWIMDERVIAKRLVRLWEAVKDHPEKMREGLYLVAQGFDETYSGRLLSAVYDDPHDPQPLLKVEPPVELKFDLKDIVPPETVRLVDLKNKIDTLMTQIAVLPESASSMKPFALVKLANALSLLTDYSISKEVVAYRKAEADYKRVDALVRCIAAFN